MMDPLDQRLSLAYDELLRGRPAQAKSHLDRVPADLRDSERFWFIASRADLDLGDPVRARTQARRGLERHPMSVPLMSTVANAEIDLQNAVEAERYLLRALEVTPDDVYLLARYAYLCVVNDQAQKADRLLERAESIDPTADVVMRTRAIYHSTVGERASAREISRRLLADNPDAPESHLVAHHVAHSTRNLSASARSLRKAAELDPARHGDLGAHARYVGHPLMAPIRLIHRVGRVKLVLGFWVLLFGSIALDLNPGPWVGAYLLLVVYSWVVPPVLRWWLRWRHR